MDNAAFYADTDNVATTVATIAKGTVVQTPAAVPVVLMEDIPMNHKFATNNIGKGERVLKYGQIIGVATRDIASGAHVHIHNVISARNGKTS